MGGTLMLDLLLEVGGSRGIVWFLDWEGLLT